MDPGFTILYEQGPCLAVNKPPGLLTQAPAGIDSLEARIKAFLKARDAKPGGVYLGVPHRLDRPASGAMVFAKHVRAARRLSEQFQGRLVQKIYWACLTGAVVPDEGTWLDYLRKVPGEARAEIVPAHADDARQAVLHYRVRARFDWGTWLEVTLDTGRMHQIRLQAAERGYPVLGDTLYGSTVPFGPQYDDPRARAIALHARSLEFADPVTRSPVQVIAPLTTDWLGLGIGETVEGAAK